MMKEDSMALLSTQLSALHSESKDAAVLIEQSIATIGKCEATQSKLLEHYAEEGLFRAVRTAAGMKQSSIASAAGVQVSTVSKLENGSTYGIALSTLRKIVTVYANLEAAYHGRASDIRETSGVQDVP